MRNAHVSAAVLLLVAVGGCSAPSSTRLTPVTFLTNYVFIGRHAPFFVGQERGFYQDAGLDVTVLPASGSTAVLTALEGGQADYGIAEVAAVVQAIGRGARVQAFGVYMDASTSGLASLEPYPDPASLQGATVAASLTDSARIILPIVLRQAGVPGAPVEWMATDPSVYFSLLLAREVDLITASIDSDVPALRRVATPRGETVHFASFADWGYDVYGYFLVATRERIATEPEQVRAFAAATARAVEYAIANPEEAARIVSDRNPSLDYDTALAHWRASLQAIVTPSVRANGYGRATHERLQRSIELVGQAFEMDVEPTPADLYADGFMPESAVALGGAPAQE